jgi:hypothetical protein
MIIRRYHELIQLPTFEERFEYLKLNGSVGDDTFGFDRFMNKHFYRSQKWKTIRDKVIVRDNGCDLGLDGYDIYGKIIIHHMNPIRVEDILDVTEYLLNPDYLICTTLETHNAIHYGNSNNLSKSPIQRTKNDTCPWRH